MWLMLQQDEVTDLVVATGEVHSVRELVELAFKEIGVEITCVPTPNPSPSPSLPPPPPEKGGR